MNKDIPRRAVDMFKAQSVETRKKKIQTPWDADDVGGCCVFLTRVVVAATRTRRDYSLTK